jgi:hypothetical protein
VKHNGAFYILNEDVVDITAHTPGVSGVWDRIFSALLDDTTPQLGGDLDTNGKYIVVDSSYGVKDENGNEIFLFTATASAVNEITIKNAATGNGPQIQATGGDTNIPVSIIPKGTGSLEIGGSATISPIGAATDINLTLAPKGDGVVSLADKVLSRAVMKDYAETISSKGSVSGAVTLDLEKGNVFVAKVSGATTTFTFSNASTSASVGFTLVLTDGGSQTVNWPAAVIWTDGAPPSLTASGVDVLTFLAIGDPATTWYGFLSGSDMS